MTPPGTGVAPPARPAPPAEVRELGAAGRAVARRCEARAEGHVYRAARPRTAKDRAILEAMMVPLRGVLTSSAAALIDLAAADAAERAGGGDAEPDVPASVARHLSAPVAGAGGPIAYLSDDEVAR